VPNSLIVWRAVLLSRRAVPKRSGVVTLACGSGETTRGQAHPSGCDRFVALGNWNCEETRWSGIGTKSDRNQYRMGTLGESEMAEAWDWRLADRQSALRRFWPKAAVTVQLLTYRKENQQPRGLPKFAEVAQGP
jgi:hypothetical protein